MKDRLASEKPALQNLFIECRTMNIPRSFVAPWLAPAILAIAFSPDVPSLADEPAKSSSTAASSLLPGAKEGFVDSGGVKIHFVSLGRSEDPLMVLIHGFPDFWYTWREQMPELAKKFHVVAIDQRGYNLSDQPEGVPNYAARQARRRSAGGREPFHDGQVDHRGTRLGRNGRLDVRHEPSRSDRPLDRAQPAASSRTHARAGDQSSAAEE